MMDTTKVVPNILGSIQNITKDKGIRNNINHECPNCGHKMIWNTIKKPNRYVCENPNCGLEISRTELRYGLGTK